MPEQFFLFGWTCLPVMLWHRQNSRLGSLLPCVALRFSSCSWQNNQKKKGGENKVNKRTHSEAIRVANLNYNIHSKSILEEISLSVPSHSFVGLIGPNGSGKTTLIRHIYRALPPPTKTIYVNGREIESISFREAAKSVTVMRQENNSEFSYLSLIHI